MIYVQKFLMIMLKRRWISTYENSYKNKVVNDLYDIKEIVDNTNIEYYIKRELLSLDIKYEEFNSYTGWNINEFKKFLLNINNEINKIKQN